MFPYERLFLIMLFFYIENLPAVIKHILLGMRREPIGPLIWPAASGRHAVSFEGNAVRDTWKSSPLDPIADVIAWQMVY